MKNSRIKVVRKILSLTQTEFAKQLGKTLRMVQYYESGESNIDDGVLLRLQEIFDVNPKWMQTGEGSTFLSSQQTSKDTLGTLDTFGTLDTLGTLTDNLQYVSTESSMADTMNNSILKEHSTARYSDQSLDCVTIRYFTDVKVSAGTGSLNTDEKSIPFTINSEFVTDEENEVIISITGDSMEPTFKNNDKILVNINQTELELLADRIYVVLIRNEIVVKRYGGRTGSVCQFSSDNSIYKSFMVDLEDESNKVIGIVTGIVYRKLY